MAERRDDLSSFEYDDRGNSPAGEGERATRSRMRDLKCELVSYRSLFDISRFSSDNKDKLVANESRDIIIDSIKSLRSDETISPCQKVHVDTIIAAALSRLKNSYRFLFDSAPTDFSNFSVIDTLSCSAESGGVDASGRLDSVQGVQEVGQAPTETSQINIVGPVADTGRSHDEIAGRSDSRTDPDDRALLSGEEGDDRTTIICLRPNPLA